MSLSTHTSRSNSIEITSETTLNQLRGLDFSNDGSGTSSRRRAPQGHHHELGRSLNFLNLDRRGTMTPLGAVPGTTTVGGASPRLRLMQNRIRRLKKTCHFDSQERLYSSDSALFKSKLGSGDREPRNPAVPARHDVWFKSLYPKQGALEKLDEAEQELEESQRGEDSDLEMDLNMSGTDLWLFANNQSAPGFLPGDRTLQTVDQDEESHIRR